VARRASRARKRARAWGRFAAALATRGCCRGVETLRAADAAALCDEDDDDDDPDSGGAMTRGDGGTAAARRAWRLFCASAAGGAIGDETDGVCCLRLFFDACPAVDGMMPVGRPCETVRCRRRLGGVHSAELRGRAAAAVRRRGASRRRRGSS